MAASASPDRRRLARDRSDAVVAGVCAGLARRFAVDPIIVRVVFVVAAVATRGGAVAAYVLFWIFMDEGEREPSPGDVNPIEGVVARIRVANWRIAAGVGFLTLAFLLVMRELGLWWSDALIWPLILAASGAALLWSQSNTSDVPPASSASRPGAAGSAEARPTAGPIGSRVASVYRGGFGIALVLGAALLFLYANGALGQARDVVLAIVVAGSALALILAPFLWRLGRNLAAERSERIRSQERAEVAAHLHDSVLQTLALMQKRADDPREVAALARRQERELRAWLFEGDADRSGESLAAALDHVAAEVEDAHGVPIDVVSVGDRDLDERGVALIAATREALTNAAKFAGETAPVAVYAEMEDGNAQVFVRDRGPGFDADTIPADRRGVRESIIARMERHGGKATIRSTPGGGTEVELAIEGDAK
jgi:signal transduction histidine kinase/phage shock protein PspC (stress-responsive transcriptional regulator)